MKHFGTLPLETERLILRRFRLEDAEAMYQNWASDPEVTRYLRWPPHQSPDKTRQLLAQWIQEYEKTDYYQWVIALKESDTPIGTISVVSQDERTEMVHVGYCIGRSWWRRGYTSEALAAVIRFFFERVGANRIESRHDPDNPHSGGVMKKCGMRYEGTLRSADYSNRGIVDASCYGILRQDYLQNK